MFFPQHFPVKIQITVQTSLQSATFPSLKHEELTPNVVRMQCLILLRKKIQEDSLCVALREAITKISCLMSFSYHPPTGWRNFTIPFLSYVLHLLQIPLTSKGGEGFPKANVTHVLANWEPFLPFPWTRMGDNLSRCGPSVSQVISSDRRCSLESVQSDLAILFLIWKLWPRNEKLAFHWEISQCSVADWILSNWKEKSCLGSFSMLLCLQGHCTLRLSKMISARLSVHTSSLCKRKCTEGRYQGKQWSKVGYGSHCWPQEMKRV